MVKIMKIFPNLNRKKDLSFLSSEDSKDFAMNIHSQNTGKFKKLESFFPNSDPTLINLLNSMLQFNPHMRLSASELLKL
jgi:serine/threonine protein kinase